MLRAIAFLGETAAIASAVTWAFANVAYERLPRSQSPFVTATLKTLLATVLTALTLFALEGTLWPKELGARATIYLAVSAIVGITLGDLAYFYALARLGARRSVFLSTLVPPASALVAWLAFGESLSGLQILGMFLTLGGVSIVLYQGTSPSTPVALGSGRDRFVAAGGAALPARDPMTGLAFGGFTVACQVAANILTKEVAAEHSALAVSTVRLLFGGTGLFAVALVGRRAREVFRPLGTKRSAGWMMVATVLGSYFGIWLYMAAILYTEIGVAVTLCTTSPIFITVLAHFFLGERATLRSFFGAVVAIAGVALLFTR